MKFFLMRHGEAGFAQIDQQRSLTDSGRAFVGEQIKKHHSRLEAVHCIVHSPYLRAQQTALIVADILGITDIRIAKEFVPESDPQKALLALEKVADQCALVVTHMPLISYLEAIICSDERYPQSFGCAELAEIDADWPARGLGCSLRLL